MPRRGDRSGKASEDVIFEGRLKYSRREARGSPIPTLLFSGTPHGPPVSNPGSTFQNQTASQRDSHLGTFLLPSPPFPPSTLHSAARGIFSGSQVTSCPCCPGPIRRKIPRSMGGGGEGIRGFEAKTLPI